MTHWTRHREFFYGNKIVPMSWTELYVGTFTICKLYFYFLKNLNVKWCYWRFYVCLFLILTQGYVFVAFFRERGRERERDIDWLSPMHTPTGDRTHNLGMCPEGESNLPPFGVWDDVPTNWATWPGLCMRFVKYIFPYPHIIKRRGKLC